MVLRTDRIFSNSFSGLECEEGRGCERGGVDRRGGGGLPLRKDVDERVELGELCSHQQDDTQLPLFSIPPPFTTPQQLPRGK